MSRTSIPSFHFPTTVGFIDDSNDFLMNLSLGLDQLLASRFFGSARSALDTDGFKWRARNGENLVRLYEGRDEADQQRQVIDLQLGDIHRKVYNDHRFEEISVVVVDYDMPRINGLEFCRRFHNPWTRKILMTGKADERLAVEAFNKGLIDRFIRKQQDDATPALNQAIRELQLDYFDRMQKPLSSYLPIGPHRFMTNEAVVRVFDSLCEQLQIVEHYLCCAPESILMLDATGKYYLFIVQNSDQARAAHEIASDQSAPEELVGMLRSGAFISYFYKTEGSYSPIYQDWRDYLHPASEISGSEKLSWTLVESPQGFRSDRFSFYTTYLKKLDEKRIWRERWARPPSSKEPS
ncbi:response regulator [Variovorax sp. KK3]|uniref:response regulator n=1 Tax=Variovorax sp. KK3 TaxID=1855728 RepID=UPI00097CADC3|nr:response regulator [Variovorax sp. KK3]